MKKYFLSFLIFTAVFSVYSVGFDFGVTADSFAGYNDDDSGYIFGFEKASLFGSVKASESVSFAVDGFYKFSYKLNDKNYNKHTFDLSIFLLSIKLGNSDLQIGRTFMGDYSGDIVGHTLDGISMTLPLSIGTLNINAGYSGFIHRDEYSLIKSVQDSYDEEDRNRVRLLVEGVDFIKEFRDISFWLSLYSYQDLRPENFRDNTALYAGGGIHGALNSIFSYSLRGNFKTGSFSYAKNATSENQGTLILAGMGALSLDWYLKSIEALSSLSPTIGLRFGVSSGDSGLKSSAIGYDQGEELSNTTLYSPMITGGPGSVFPISNQNLTYGKLAMSIKPHKRLQTQIGSVVFFRTVEGVTGSDDVDPKENGNYMGTEVSLAVNYRPFSDLGVSLSSGLFIPNKSVMISDHINWVSSVYLSLSL